MGFWASRLRVSAPSRPRCGVARERQRLFGKACPQHGDGIFAGTVEGHEPHAYHLCLEVARQPIVVADPYSFGLPLRDLDTYLHAEGTLGAASRRWVHT